MRTKNNFRSVVVDLKDDVWIQNQRHAGKIAAQTLTLLNDLVKQKTTKSLVELNSIAEEFIVNNNCIPTFKNYKPIGHKPFPYGVCISVNKTLVHGIPSDYKLQDGDLVSFDLGCTYNGAIADSAITCVYGDYKCSEDKELVNTTYDCLMKSIASIKINEKLGIIGEVIFNVAKNKGFNVIEAFGGHGLSLNKAHSEPFIANKSSRDDGIRAQAGMSLAIEPLLTGGTTKHKVSDNGWDIVLPQLNAHWEHTIFIHKDKIEIMTLRQHENYI